MFQRQTKAKTGPAMPASRFVVSVRIDRPESTDTRAPLAGVKESSTAEQIDIDQVSLQYFARIHRAALMLTGNPWDADDLAQETFLVLARQAGRTFEGRSSLYTFLYGILLNLDRRHRRRAGMKKRKLRVLWGNEPAERSAPAAETAIEVAEWKKGLWSEVAKLPDGQRQALVLRFASHLQYDEIAAVMECPVGTVKSRIFHGLAALRSALSGQDQHEAGQIPQHAWEDLTHAV
jgi:RNA polymerase sigma-70 factor (ECF subfamily)